MNIGLVFKVLSMVGSIVSLCMLWPMWWAFQDETPDLIPLVASMMMGLCVSYLFFFFGKSLEKKPDEAGEYKEVGIREAFAVVTFSWLFASFVGALPFVFSGAVESLTDGFFEAMSGFTTTGATVIADVESHPRGIMFWRSLTHWLGGMGIVVLSLAVLPFLGVGGMELYKAEVPTPVPEKLTPRVRQTAILLWGVYVLLTVVESIILMFCGLDVFDSLTHSFGTMATGGLSTLNHSVGEFNKPAVEWVITIFMLLAGTNFALHFVMLRGKWNAWWKDEEARFYLGVILFSVATIFAFLWVSGYGGFEKTLRDSAFQVVSIITTTGYMTADYELWPRYCQFLLLLLMFIGGCAGSTSGGMKQLRIMILLKKIKAQMSRLLHPNQVLKIRVNNYPLRGRTLAAVESFFVVYLLLFALFSLIMSALGLDMVSAFSSVIATMSNIGPGFAMVGPSHNYGFIPDIGKWVLSLCMLLGRLEIMTVLMLFLPSTWSDK